MGPEEIYLLLLLWFPFLQHSSLPNLFSFLQCSCMTSEDMSFMSKNFALLSRILVFLICSFERVIMLVYIVIRAESSR